MNNQHKASVLVILMCNSFAHVFAATSISYTYDSLGRLESAARSDGPSISYAYDAVDNFVSQSSATPPDADGDRLPDAIESLYGFSVNLIDTDNDGVSDYDEVCYDNNCSDYNPYDASTNPTGTDLKATDIDTDGDGVSDAVEIAVGTSPLDPSDYPNGDLNGDGVVNVVDILLAQQILFGNVSPTTDQIAHGDVAPLVDGVPSPNGAFDAGDLLIIQRKASGAANF